MGHVDGDHAAGGGLEVILSPRLQGDGFTSVLKQVLLVHLKFDEVVEVDGVEQAFNHRVALDVHGAERRVNRRPGRADQRIGSDAAGLQGRRQSGAGGRFVVEAEVGGEGVGGGGGSKRTLVRGLAVKLRHLGELVAGDGGVADACGGGEHRVDVRNQAFAVHDRHTAGLGAFHDERDDDIAHGVLGGAAVRVVVPVGVEVDVQIVLAGRGVKRADLVVLVAQGGAVGGVVGDVADPGDVRGLADEVLGAGGLAECGEIVVLSGIGGLLFVLHALDGGGFEAAEDVGDRLVDGGDAGNGDRAGDGTHGIGGVALVFGLPELVLTPPTQQVVVDDGYERHGLGVFAHEHREPSHVGRDHLEFGGLRVGQCELFERGGRVGENVVVGQQASGSCLFSRNAISGEQLGGEFAGVRVVHTGFDALQQVLEAVGVSRVDPREGEFGEALRPLKVGHGGQVSEVRLGGLVQGFDDFLAAGVELFGVLHDAHEQTAAFGGVVLELVNVGVQVAQAGGHATDGLAGRHPVGGLRGEHVVGLGVGRNAGRLDKQLLDFGAGVSLLGGHRGGADKHTVDRHVGQAVGVGPLAGNVVGSAFRGADAAAGDQHEVVAGAHFGVGGG